MAIKSSQPNVTIIDDDSFIPPGTVGFQVVPTIDNPQDDVESLDAIEFSESEGDIEFGLLPPGRITIVNQIMRVSPNGQQVVDVYIDVEDVAGAQDYEIRLSKS